MSNHKKQEGASTVIIKWDFFLTVAVCVKRKAEQRCKHYAFYAMQNAMIHLLVNTTHKIAEQ